MVVFQLYLINQGFIHSYLSLFVYRSAIYSDSFPFTFSQTGNIFVLQDLSPVLRLKHSVGHHGFCHHLNGDGHGSGADSRDGTKELANDPLTRPTLLSVHQQNPVGEKEKVRNSLKNRTTFSPSHFMSKVSELSGNAQDKFTKITKLPLRMYLFSEISEQAAAKLMGYNLFT